MILQNEFRATCHAIGKIMTEPKDKSKHQFSLTCLEHIFEWLGQQPEFYGRRASIDNVYLDKGLACEDDSIDFASRVLGWGFVTKNTKRIYIDFLEGECDVELARIVADIKNSWDHRTFPLFKTEIPVEGYEAQLQGYMHLYNKPQGQLVYTLMDAPEWLIERQARKKAYELGYDGDLPAEIYEEVKTKMTYSNFEDWKRIKVFNTERDTMYMGRVYKRVMEIREFIKSLPDLESFMNIFQEQLI